MKGPENIPFRQESSAITAYIPTSEIDSNSLNKSSYISSHRPAPQPHHAPNFRQRAKLVRRHIPESGLWACDYCQVATFVTYEEAYNHEQICSLNHHNMVKITPQFPEKTSCQRVMRLSMPADKDSLSDRQCYVRSHFFDIFTASALDVATRHSKGAQKLYIGQIGLRCMHCTHLASKDRTERAICYPSSISRIYQTIADMQRFHFESCSAIPEDMKQTYKSLKTTRPRGVGSPQEYWIISARKLGLIDTPRGIRLASCVKKFQMNLVNHTFSLSPPLPPVHSRFQNMTSHDSHTNRRYPKSLSPMRSDSSMNSTSHRFVLQNKATSSNKMHYRDSDEANMLLALRYTHNPKHS